MYQCTPPIPNKIYEQCADSIQYSTTLRERRRTCVYAPFVPYIFPFDIHASKKNRRERSSRVQERASKLKPCIFLMSGPTARQPLVCAVCLCVGVGLNARIYGIASTLITSNQFFAHELILCLPSARCLAHVITRAIISITTIGTCCRGSSRSS